MFKAAQTGFNTQGRVGEVKVRKKESGRSKGREGATFFQFWRERLVSFRAVLMSVFF